MLNKKSWITYLITLSCAFLLLFAVGCSCSEKEPPHVHTYTNSFTCHDRACIGCGEEILATTAHKVFDAETCEDQNCVYCGETVYGEHFYDNNFACVDKECKVCHRVLSATDAHRFLNSQACVDRICLDCGTAFDATAEHSFLGGECTCTHVDVSNYLTFTSVTKKGVSYYAVSGYSGSYSKIALPKTYNGKAVVSITSGAFSNSTVITSVCIPDSYLEVGYGAFANCKKLEQVSFSGSTKLEVIGEHAFAGCVKLAGIIIPEKVQTISFEAFKDCSNLKTVITHPNIKNIDSNAFRNCTSLVSIEAYALENLGYNAFYNCLALRAFNVSENATFTSFSEGVFFNCNMLSDIVIPNSVNHIGKNAFAGCNSLMEIVIPASVLQINEQAFSDCYKLVHVRNLSSVKLAETDTFREVVTGKYATFNTVITKAPNGIVRFNDGEKEYFIGYTGSGKYLNLAKYFGITAIYDYAFNGNTTITKVSLPTVLTEIGQAAFKNCTKLEQVEYGKVSALKSIGEEAFLGCAKLTAFTIPKSVDFIGGYAFYGCDKLVQVRNFSGKDAGLPDNLDMEIKNNNADFKGVVLVNENGVVTYTVGDKVYLLDYSGTAQTLNLANSNITDIYAQAFDGNNTLTAIVLPANLKTIGEAAFRYCSELKSISIPASVEEIGRTAFADCGKLESVSFGENSALTKISQSTFENCSALKSITIPKGIELIEDRAFFCCDSLQTLYFEKGAAITSIYSYAFYGCTSLVELNIPATVQTVGGYAFYACTGIEELSFGENSEITYVGDYAFYRCTALTTVDLGKYESLSEIGSYAFSGCLAVETIILNGNINYIYFNAFDGLINIKDLYYGGSVEQWELLEDDDLTNNEFYMDNVDVTNPAVNRYYYYIEGTTVIDPELNYWYYDANGKIVTILAE